MNKRTVGIVIAVIALIGALAALAFVLPKDDNSNKESSPSQSQSEIISINKNANLEDIIFESGKSNVYLFWGDGCGHCKKEFAYLEGLQEEYGGLFNVYAFEVWNNEDNVETMNSFARIIGDETSGAPYTIVGNKSFSGFSDTIGNTILEQIKHNSSNTYDVYKEYLKI